MILILKKHLSSYNVFVQATNIIKKGVFIAKNKNYLIQASTNSTEISICTATSSGVIPLSKKRLQTTFIFSKTSIICLSGSYKRTTNVLLQDEHTQYHNFEAYL